MKSKKTQNQPRAPSTTLSQKEVISTQTPWLSSEPTRKEQKLLPLFIVLITLLAFLPVLKNGLVNLDSRLLEDNLSYRELGWQQLRWMFGAFHFGQYQPLAWLSLWFDQVLWWADPFGHHLTNLFLHVANALLFYHISFQLLSYSNAAKAAPGQRWLSVAAGIAALGFAIHPLRVETVAWASARGELVASTFFLVSLFSYLKAHAPGALHHKATRWTIISIGAYLFSLLAGPGGIFLPLILLMLDVYPLDRLAESQNRSGIKAQWLLWEKAPYIALSSLCFAITFVAGNYQPIDQSTYREHTLTWLLHQLAAPAFYLGKTIWPFGLSPDYELSGWYLATYAAASAMTCVGVVALRKRFPALLPAWVCYLVLLMPLLRSEFPVTQVLADRYTYLASCSWALLVGGVICRWLRSCAARHWHRWPTPFVLGLTVVVCVLLGNLTWRQVRVWRDSETLWRNPIAVNPTSGAYFNLASLSEAQGKYEDAIAFYRQALAINPHRWQAHERAARLLEKRGMIREAVAHYRAAVEFNPDAINARESLAGGLVNQDEIGEAVQQFRKLLELAPDRNGARVKLGTVLAVSGHLDEAAEILAAAVKADPNNAKVVLSLGQVMAARGKMSEAVRFFREAVRLRTEDAEAQESLGRGLLELGHKEEASIHLNEALRILRSTPAAR